jgi:hypothetical protein
VPPVVCRSNATCAAQSPFGICAGASGNGAQVASNSSATYANVAFSQCFSTAAAPAQIGVSRSLSGGNFSINDGLLLWDTAALPDNADLISAAVILRVTTVDNANARSLQGEWFNWGPSCDASDWTPTAASTAFSVPNSSIPPNVDVSIALSGATANVNRTGLTYLRLHESGGQPTGLNRVVFAAYDNTTLPGPRLQVCYQLP